MTIILALGANRSGPWGDPRRTIARAIEMLSTSKTQIILASCVYWTQPVGGSRRRGYCNAALVARTSLPPVMLLRWLKTIERRAGRRANGRNGDRPLDLDIVDYGGRVLGWPGRGRHRPSLVLPHPLSHVRAFVLVPVLEVAPHWWHPALRVPGRRLLARRPPREVHGVVRAGPIRLFPA